MRRKYVILPGKELFFACERLLLFRYPKPRVRSFRRDTRASRATSFIISTAVIWYTVLFRQNRTDRPIGTSMRPSILLSVQKAGLDMLTPKWPSRSCPKA